MLHMGQGNLKHPCRLSDEWIESSQVKKGLEVLMYEKLYMQQNYSLACRLYLFGSSHEIKPVYDAEREGFSAPKHPELDRWIFWGCKKLT